MKTFFTILLLMICLQVRAQDYFKTLVGRSYFHQAGGGSDPKNIEKPLTITYNRRICELNIGGIVHTFELTSYMHETSDGVLSESFVNKQTGAMAKGWYIIAILFNKPGKCQLTIHTPLAAVYNIYTATDAAVYAQKEPVGGQVYAATWQRLEEQMKAGDNIARAKIISERKEVAKLQRDDSIKRAAADQELAKKLAEERQAAIKQKTADSIRQVAAINARIAEEDAMLSRGNNFNNVPGPELKRIAKLLDSIVNVKVPKLYTYGTIRVIIDKDGNVTSCAKSNSPQNITDDVYGQINEVLPGLGLREPPFNKNNKAYPPIVMFMYMLFRHPTIQNRRKRKYPSGPLLNKIMA